MITDLMRYGFVIALLIVAAGLALERVAAWRGGPRRGIWFCALLLSLVLPTLRVVVSSQAVGPVAKPVLRSAPIEEPAPPARAPDYQFAHQAPAFAATPSVGFKRVWPIIAWSEAHLGSFWIASSLGLLAFFGFSWLRLKMTARHWRREAMDDQVVWITETLGPAVFGFLRPQILIPAWALEMPCAARCAMLTHEQEHIAAGDPWLLLLGLLIVVAAPWNLPLWWQFHRLRFAIEVDCDARVLRRGADPRAYGEVLLLVGQRGIFAPAGAIALTEPVSQLRRRIKIITERRLPHGRVVIGGLIALCLGCVAVAAELQAPAVTIPGWISTLRLQASNARSTPPLASADIQTRAIGVQTSVDSAAGPQASLGCFTVHGRLEVANGTPAARIWRIGTDHIFGVPDGPPGHELDGVPLNVRRILQADVLTKVYGDFYVCPIAEARKGRMQMVHLQRAAITAVLRPKDLKQLPALSTQDSWTILTSPIRVDAVLHARSAEGFSFIFELHGTQGVQNLRTFISGGSLSNALDALHKAVEWRAPYLFINTNCNGNRTCGFYAVFKVQADDLLPLGQLMARGPVSLSYQGGHFIDYWGGERPPEYDWGLCMACQPQVKVILSETNGHLEVLRDQTWTANKSDWDSNEKTMTDLLREKHGEVNGDPTYYQALVENAVIDKYCGRNAELTQLLTRPHNDDVIAGLATVPVLQPPSESRKPLDPGWYE